MVWKRTPLAFPERRMDRLASVMPTLAHSSLAVIPRSFKMSLRYTRMANAVPPFVRDRSDKIGVVVSSGAGLFEIVPPAAEHINF